MLKNILKQLEDFINKHNSNTNNKLDRIEFNLPDGVEGGVYFAALEPDGNIIEDIVISTDDLEFDIQIETKLLDIIVTHITDSMGSGYDVEYIGDGHFQIVL